MKTQKIILATESVVAFCRQETSFIPLAESDSTANHNKRTVHFNEYDINFVEIFYFFISTCLKCKMAF